MKVIVSQIITVLISLSAIIAPVIPVYNAEWVEAHDGPREFISRTKRDRIREQGEMETFGITNTHGIRRMTIINNTPESAIELTNKWKNQQTYRPVAASFSPTLRTYPATGSGHDHKTFRISLYYHQLLFP
ncbi:hypothetical protein PCANC_20077 [Puccinia coronata f. sp. avenae]|uniref:Uncharacterized protein n=1 Tax=Puccinia coronata f. sp. avenae TaxID=200324 RepID=A0A2N5U8U2_9BASI|nr:hypothetical protein PCANC_20077 [Puccinia coronata f. sp. avenae]